MDFIIRSRIAQMPTRRRSPRLPPDPLSRTRPRYYSIQATNIKLSARGIKNIYIVYICMPKTGELTRSANSSGNGTGLDVDAREVKVLVAIALAITGELEDAQVPVRAVGRGRGRDRGYDLRERVAALGVPEADLVAGEVLLWRKSAMTAIYIYIYPPLLQLFDT